MRAPGQIQLNYARRLKHKFLGCLNTSQTLRLLRGSHLEISVDWGLGEDVGLSSETAKR